MLLLLQTGMCTCTSSQCGNVPFMKGDTVVVESTCCVTAMGSQLAASMAPKALCAVTAATSMAMIDAGSHVLQLLCRVKQGATVRGWYPAVPHITGHCPMN
jgi:hypothetical protein